MTVLFAVTNGSEIYILSLEVNLTQKNSDGAVFYLNSNLTI